MKDINEGRLYRELHDSIESLEKEAQRLKCAMELIWENRLATDAYKVKAVIGRIGAFIRTESGYTKTCPNPHLSKERHAQAEMKDTLRKLKDNLKG